MCYGCWTEQGSPKDLPSNFAEIRELLDRLGEKEPFVVGPLHLQIEDWNLEDEFFEGELEVVEFQDGRREEATPLKKAIYAKLGAIPEAQRYAVMALHEGFFEPGAQSRHNGA